MPGIVTKSDYSKSECSVCISMKDMDNSINKTTMGTRDLHRKPTREKTTGGKTAQNPL